MYRTNLFYFIHTHTYTFKQKLKENVVTRERNTNINTRITTIKRRIATSIRVQKGSNVILSEVKENYQYSPSSRPQFRQGDPHSWTRPDDNFTIVNPLWDIIGS